MKRILICLILILTLMSGVVAAENPAVCDYEDLLTATEENQLQRAIDQLVDEYQFQPVIVTVDSLGGKSPKKYAEDFFLDGGYGIGENRDGIVLLIAMNTRDWYIATHGNTRDVISDSDIDDISEQIVAFLSNGNYSEAFASFLSLIQQDYEAEETLWIRDLLIALVIGTVISGITLLIMRSSMNTVKKQSGASNYMANDSFDLYECRDLYLYSRTTKVRKSQNNSSGSRSSGGSSFGGRGGKF